jgi:carbon monoxide dehydrogenase subunit G
VRHVSVSIDRPPQEVYDFVSDAENFLPKWATSSNAFVTRADGGWIIDSPVGKVKMQFAAKNALGILDFDFILESGVTIHNPMRVIPNGNGSELVRTVLREPGMSGERFADETEWAEKDLATLRDLLNRQGL